ncbi:uncharacterized protein LOC144154323 [Haemaphysalis longicornis]
MASAPKRKSRKKYLHENSEFTVPKSTWYARSKKQRLQHALETAPTDDSGPSTVAASDVARSATSRDDLSARLDDASEDSTNRAFDDTMQNFRDDGEDPHCDDLDGQGLEHGHLDYESLDGENPHCDDLDDQGLEHGHSDYESPDGENPHCDDVDDQGFELGEPDYESPDGEDPHCYDLDDQGLEHGHSDYKSPDGENPHCDDVDDQGLEHGDPDYESLDDEDLDDADWHFSSGTAGASLPPLTEEEILSSSFSKLSTEKLPNLGTSKAGAAAMAMSFAIAHGLTWSALGDLAKLVNSIAGMEVLPRSEYMFRKLWSAQKEDVVRYWYRCEQCGDVLKVENGDGLCEVCDRKVSVASARNKSNFFITLNVRKQLSTLVQNTKDSLAEGLALRSEQCGDEVTDIVSGAAFRELRENEKLGVDDLTLTINTDGSPVFKSSKTSMWPLQFTLNELPPSVRFKHPVLAGLWFGPGHPEMQTFLSRFTDEISAMTPIVWEHEGSVHCSRVFVLCCAVDAPARAAVMNMILHNGCHGCPRCFTSTTRSGGSLRYTSQQTEPRTHLGVVRDMHMAFVQDERFNGFNGPSALMNLRGFNLVHGVSVDYMHCVLQGVCKQVTELMFYNPMKGNPTSIPAYYIGDPPTLKKVNQRLLSIHPPHCVTRLPRPIGVRIQWKATEWRNWLLYYALPCLDGVLPLEYWRHLSKLSEAVHILLQEAISPGEIDRAECLLFAFVERCAPPLFEPTAATFNVHSLLHLGDSVRDLGPLWANSCFTFEGGNGKLVKSITAANGLPHQVVERVVMEQCLDSCLAVGCMLTEDEKSICKEFLEHAQVSSAVQEGDATLLGRNKHAILSTPERDALNELGYEKVECYDKLIVKHQIYHSTLYKRPTKSDTTFVETCKGCFRIEKIVLASRCGCSKCFLLCREVLFLDSSSFPRHIKPCFLSGSDVPTVLEPSDIIRSCIYIEFNQEKKAFLCLMPNMIERD